MLKNDWNIYLLYLSIVVFEIISFFLLSRLMTDAINHVHLIPIYVVPLAGLKWIQMSKTSISSYLYLAVPIVQVFLLYLLGYSLMILGFLLLFSCWRIYTFIKESYPDQQGIWLGFVLAATFFILFIKRDFLFEYVGWFLVLLLLFIVIRVLIQLKENTWVLMKGSYRQLFFHITWVLAALLLLFQGALYILHYTIPFLGRWIGFIVGYPISWLLEKFGIELNEKEEQASSAVSEVPEDHPFKNLTQANDGELDQILLFIIVLVIIGVVLLLLYLARKNLQNLESDQTSMINVVASDSAGLSFFQSLKEIGKGLYSQPAKNEVRIQFSKFQAFMKKCDLERKPAETVEEWFTRLKLTDSDAVTILKIYQQSRYSYTSIPESELQAFQKGLKNIKKRLIDESSNKA
jgi:hypothetical protein